MECNGFFYYFFIFIIQIKQKGTYYLKDFLSLLICFMLLLALVVTVAVAMGVVEHIFKLNFCH